MKIKLISTLILALSLTGCRYSNYFQNGKFHDAPYTNLECYNSAKEVGFEFKVPPCFCNSGILLRYKLIDGGERYEIERGYLNDDRENDIKLSSSSPSKIEEIIYGGKKLPPPEKSTGIEREIWNTNQELFRGMWENYYPVMEKMAYTCFEEWKEKR